ncbi:hypothetical protein JQU17_15935 [Ponticoccus sp. SC2-23]|uniref:hypothetical protein n=1 Tax=Alexandriicola marinus TaxID=2081710 RepID=UPI000FDA4593|nr:hypothetical protein [Alexandriicola marinus]MBM1220845.1 hypothetical protein [Ponticoccus sp. SC6-9]MBM1225415.1 hypothetical protein [Ponticoccus sp. SC6-15]MBM1227598.1 hypothetical protein [Ponticoccus sp. SC6-38]MBM1234764.1 hypothetical protein [Ponticoccus sp. SC6-45]MBM1238100.1 hypothetical protein [Ponticoccus sp. SC6-49]MBM1244267.1 hypothetical protein [Ponticoccus sp. SC2-64]MBM1248288.1 hypothetical protein [Ponticoccus sp. SC6-42]MBM1252500.1 hypothetical protein [Pontico
MASKVGSDQSVNILVVAQAGRLQYEALLFALSLRRSSPDFPGRVIVAEPERAGAWRKETAIRPDIREILTSLDIEIAPFRAVHFGERYPNGNKIEALSVLPPGEPFLFLDTDTLITGDLTTLPRDFSRPTASMKREGTWPVEELYWPGYTAIWKSLYDKFGLDFESSLDLSQPDEYWQRYLYFNAGWFLGPDPAAFGKLFLDYARAIRGDAPPELVIQPLDPWLDQVALPLVVHTLGGGRPGPEWDGLDGDVTCHYRTFPLLYAKERDATVDLLEELAAPNRIKRILKDYIPIRKMVFHGQGRKARAEFDQSNLPAQEKDIRRVLRAKGWWMR